MERFSINIERLIDRSKDEGKFLQGIVTFQYPIYCIHTTIKDSTPDIIYKVDLTLLKLFKLVPRLSLDDIPAITNLSKNTISERLEQLQKEDLLEIRNGFFSLSQLGLEYLVKGKILRYRLRSYDFFINGRTLQPLKSSFYKQYRRFLLSEAESETVTAKDGKEWERKYFKPDFVFAPVHKNTIVSNILSVPLDQREKYEIPLGCETIESISYSQLSFPLMIGLFLKSDLNISKGILNGYVQEGLDDDAKELTLDIKDAIDKTLIQIEHYKEKYQTKSNLNAIDSSNGSDSKIFNPSKIDVLGLLKQEKAFKGLDGKSVVSESNRILVKITTEILDLNKLKSKELLKKIAKGRDYILQPYQLNGVWLMLINYMAGDGFVKALVNMQAEIQEARSDIDDFVKLIDLYAHDSTNDQSLIYLQEFDILEKIHMKNHMTEFK